VDNLKFFYAYTDNEIVARLNGLLHLNNQQRLFVLDVPNEKFYVWKNENEKGEEEDKNKKKQDNEAWSCSACTYENVPARTLCEICATPREQEQAFAKTKFNEENVKHFIEQFLAKKLQGTSISM